MAKDGKCIKCSESAASGCWCRKHHAEYMREYRKRNPNAYYYNRSEEDRIKQRSRARLMEAIRRKRIVRPDKCEQCNASEKPEYLAGMKVKPKIEAHHKDYSKPLEVNWLCKQCHVIADQAMKNTRPHRNNSL